MAPITLKQADRLELFNKEPPKLQVPVCEVNELRAAMYATVRDAEQTAVTEAPAWSARRECLLVHCGFVTREMLSQSSWVATRNLFSEQHRKRKKVRALPTRTQGPTIRFETPWH